MAGPLIFSTTVLAELGFELDPIIESSLDGWSTELSFERLDELDADILFWQVRQDKDGNPNAAALELVEANPLWPNLPAVQADQVHLVDNRPWYFPSILGAHIVLDDVEEAFLADR